MSYNGNFCVNFRQNCVNFGVNAPVHIGDDLVTNIVKYGYASPLHCHKLCYLQFIGDLKNWRLLKGFVHEETFYASIA